MKAPESRNGTLVPLQCGLGGLRIPDAKESIKGHCGKPARQDPSNINASWHAAESHRPRSYLCRIIRGAYSLHADYHFLAECEVNPGGVSFVAMERPAVYPAKVRKRGNPNWGQPARVAPAIPTEFEMRANQLRLTPETYVDSEELRCWCERNRNRCYIPEWLLDAWDLPVDPDLSLYSA
jgi:hypothetical protein